MEDGLMEWIALAFAVSKVFEIVARMTPTTKDDNVAQKLRKVSAILGVAVPDRIK